MSTTAAQSHPIRECQICASPDLNSLLFLGYVPPVNTMPPVGERALEQPAFPLELLRCGSCGLVQIGLEVAPEVLFPHSYPYLSGTTRILRSNFADLYRDANQLLGLEPTDLVVDVGSNDGTLLSNFKAGGHRVLGVEPSQAGDVARTNGIETVTAYFGLTTARTLRERYGAARVVTAANVFAHIGNVHNVTDGIVELLGPRGVFISESHYLLDLVETIQYDTVYHEHLRYYSLASLTVLLERHGLEVFDVKRIPTHGGSIRVYAARAGDYPVQPSVHERLADEAAAGLTDGSALATFRERVIRSKLELHKLLAELRQPGVRVVGIGAPSRASTLINYVGLDDGLMEAVMEVSSSHKLNKYIPGTRIPVIDEARLYTEQPDYALLLSWHIAEELAANLRRNGYRGRFIVPLPTPRIL
ncbi:MAG: methyltransferase domain-containing protein [Azospirillum sp.]|nr:methyltransferase domain-containing protein [Azospirillum sp.]